MEFRCNSKARHKGKIATSVAIGKNSWAGVVSVGKKAMLHETGLVSMIRRLHRSTSRTSPSLRKDSRRGSVGTRANPSKEA